MALASIVLVDDDAPFRQTIGRVLRSAGHEVREAADGTEALQLLRAQCPEVLITDIIMPGGDGIELIVAAKARHPDMRVLAISGRGSMAGLDVLELAGFLGVDGVMAKPFCADELFARLQALASPAESGQP